MTASIIIGSVLIAIAVLILIWGIITSNNLIAKKNRVEQCRSGICVALKQRNDLIPNLVASLKAYMGHENEILTRIAELRSRSDRAPETEQIKDGVEISSLLKRINAIVESNPDLKANEQFVYLQYQITDMENELQAIRRTYNATVTDYNNAVEMFPSSYIASIKHFGKEALIQIPESELGDIHIKEIFG